MERACLHPHPHRAHGLRHPPTIRVGFAFTDVRHVLLALGRIEEPGGLEATRRLLQRLFNSSNHILSALADGLLRFALLKIRAH
jgi:hypothetical protein